MSNKKRRNQAQASEIIGLKLSELVDRQATASTSQLGKTSWFGYLKTHWWTVGIIAFIALGAFGASLKYLEADARREIAGRSADPNNLNNNEKPSWLNHLNPFLPNPLPPPTPQLSKEYLYAGSRLLSVEDANATAAPPADLAVWRASTGMWYVMGGPGSQQTFYQWGAEGDVTVPGDYDGDGKTDFSVFRPSNNNWYVIRSSDGSYFGLNFGLMNDKVAQADYDGDGRTDQAVFRQTSGLGYWYIWRSSMNDFIGVQFGFSSDTPAAADYDGDGKADIAVWRNSSATFYILRSSDSQVQTQAFGLTNDVPMCGDYDGDGRADVAVRRGAAWIILNSSTGQEQPPITWKDAGDVAVPNDYDGDGKLDIAVWRPTNPGVGNWYIRQSSLNGQERNVVWGELGDKPVPAFYRR